MNKKQATSLVTCLSFFIIKVFYNYFYQLFHLVVYQIAHYHKTNLFFYPLD